MKDVCQQWGDAYFTQQLVIVSICCDCIISTRDFLNTLKCHVHQCVHRKSGLHKAAHRGNHLVLNGFNYANWILEKCWQVQKNAPTRIWPVLLCWWGAAKQPQRRRGWLNVTSLKCEWWRHCPKLKILLSNFWPVCPLLTQPQSKCSSFEFLWLTIFTLWTKFSCYFGRIIFLSFYFSITHTHTHNTLDTFSF